MGKPLNQLTTSVNLQSQKFTIVQNKPLIHKLASAMGQVMGQPDYDLYKPDAILLVSSRRGYAYSQIETALAIQNAYLAATALGLGTVWTDQMRNMSDEPAVREVLREMKIPSDHICWNVLPLGVPAEKPVQKKRTEQINIID